MITKIHEDYLNPDNERFYNEYFEFLIRRLTKLSSSLNLENKNDSEIKLRFRNNMKAFEYLKKLLLRDENLSENIVVTTANIINNDSPYISKGYRKIGDHIVDSDIPISSAEMIPIDVSKLLSKYETEWTEMEPFEREAKFHIEFIRIHPFEDGNGRTSRLLLNFNLLKQRLAPLVITEDLAEYYHTYIRDNDVEGMANLFRIQSTKENIIMKELYNEYKQTIHENNRKLI
jgi:Fic family protein